MSGPRDFAEWQRLTEALLQLITACGARNGYVLDAWANLWCADSTYDGPGGDRAMEETDAELKRLRVPLNRGGRLDVFSGSSYFKSFAGIYVLQLRFDGAIDEAVTRRRVTAALPKIEALTLLLPPPDGPGSGGNEGFGVA